VKIKVKILRSKYLYNYCKQQTGTVLVTVAVLMPLLMMITGLLVDIGRAFMYKEAINKACMISSEEAVKEIEISLAQQYGFTQLEVEKVQEISIKYFNLNYKQESGCIINYFNCTIFDEISNPKYIRVSCRGQVECFFLKIFGIYSIEINTSVNSRLKGIKN